MIFVLRTRYDRIKALILYFSKVGLLTKRLAASADLISTMVLPLPSRLMDKISALAISNTILDKTEKCMMKNLSKYT